MAFSDEIFPTPPMIHEISRSVIDPVSISTNGSYEYRVRRSRWERFQWTLPTQTMTHDQKEATRAFLSSRRSSLDSFRFQDPEMPQFEDAILPHETGEYWMLSLPIDDTTPGDHPIFNPDVSALSVTVNGSADTIDSFAISSGKPVIQVAGTSSTDTVRVSGPIYFTVRLDSNFNETLRALNPSNKPIGHSVEAINFIEVYGEY